MKFEMGPPGVNFWLTQGERTLRISPDGYVKVIREPGNFWLNMKSNGKNIPFVVTDRNNENKPIRLLTGKVNAKVKINVRHSKTGEQYLRTFPNSNNMRVLSLDYDVAPTVFTISLSSQSGDLFLACDRTFEFGLSPNNGTWVYPKEWPSLVGYVKLITDYNVVLQRPEPPGFRMCEETGLVKWWDSSLGFGCVWIEHEGRTIQAAVHWSQIQQRGRRAFLQPGEKVIYTDVRQKVNTTRYHSEFKKELVGVEVLAA
jgi:cold shock CspA family protein